MTGSNKSPYRLPCSGTTLCANGPLYQHARASEKNIPVYLYNGVVPNWASDSPETIIPYERFNPANPCSGVSNCSGTDACWTAPDYPSAPPCLPWTGSDDCQYALPSDWPTSWYQPQMLTSASISGGGENYQVGDIISANGGTLSTYIGQGSGAATVTVAKADNTGAITAVTITNTGSYQTNPSSPNTMTGGHGTGASITLSFASQTMSFANCFDYGYKNVQAMRQWHGQPGYFFGFDNPAVYYCGSSNDTPSECNYTLYNAYSDSASQNKYLTCAATISYSQYDDGTDVSSSAQIDLNLSIDAQSGVITNTSSASGSPTQDCAFNPGTPEGGLVSMLWYNVEDWWNYFWGFGGLYFPDGVGITGTVTCDDDSYELQLVNPEFGDTVTSTLSWTLGADSLTMSMSINYPDGGADVGDYAPQQIVTLTLTDSSVDFSYTYYEGSYYGEPTLFQIMTISGTLSDTNTPDDVQSDIATLLDEWDLTDDTEYPWRTDDYTSIAPFVSRNEVPSPVALSTFKSFESSSTVIDTCPDGEGESPGPYEMVATTDPNAAMYDGSILGAPMPAGYQGFFDFNYQDYQVCDSTDPITLYFNGWGQYNAGQNGIPLNATQWTNNQLAVQFCPGAWIFYNHNPSWISCAGAPDGYEYYPGVICIAQKWAETKMGFPSQNFARPAGMDRFLCDETNVYNISATSGSGPGAQITLEQTKSCADATLASTIGLWGGPAVGGFFEIASAAGNVVTLGDLVYAVPSNWASSAAASTAGTDANYCFGLLRWSTGDTDTDPPAIMGRASIISTAEYESNPDVTELTTNAMPTLGMGQTESDYVDIYDNLMNLIAGDLAVTRLTDTTFTVPVAFSTLSGAAWIMTTGSPAYYWNDQYPKGDYAYTDWTWWPRQICESSRVNEINTDCETNGCSNCPDTETVNAYPFSAFTQEASCVPFTPCAPSVLCISPNGESFTNGTTYDFPTIDFDEQYGSGWQAQIQQVMEDLYFQSPHVPAQGPECTGDAYAWEQDNGSCESGTSAINYYAHAPMVECRLTVPDDAPALTQPVNNVETCGVNEIVIGWSSPVGIISGDCAPANTLFPPGSNGIGFTSFNIWNLWSNECDCISSGGNFSTPYQNQVLGCQ